MKGLSIAMKCRSIDIGLMDRITANSDKVALCVGLIEARNELDLVPDCDLNTPSVYALDLVSEELQRVVIDLRASVDEFRDQIHAIDEEVL